MEAELLHADKHDKDKNRFLQFLENAWKIVGVLVIIKYDWNLFSLSEVGYILTNQVHPWTWFVPINFYHFPDGNITDGKLYT